MVPAISLLTFKAKVKGHGFKINETNVYIMIYGLYVMNNLLVS